MPSLSTAVATTGAVAATASISASTGVKVPAGAGSHEVRGFLGRRIESTYTVSDLELNKQVSVKSTSGPIRLTGTTTFTPAENGTAVTTTFKADLRGIFQLAEPVVFRMVKRQVGTDWIAAKDVLEAGP